MRKIIAALIITLIGVIATMSIVHASAPTYRQPTTHAEATAEIIAMIRRYSPTGWSILEQTLEQRRGTTVVGYSNGIRHEVLINSMQDMVGQWVRPLGTEYYSTN